MASEDVVVQNFIIYKCGSALAFLGAMWLFRGTIRYYTQQKLFAYFMNRFTKKMNKGMRPQKETVFGNIHKYKANVRRDLIVLEVGAGSAANLEFLPPNCKLTCLDPNPHFEGYIKENLGKTDTVVSAEIVRGYAENIPLESNKFDVVICTLVLCCVTNVEKSLAEIKRVMKPVGTYVAIFSHYLI